MRAFLLQHVGDHPHDIAAVAAARFGLSRNAINGYIHRLIEAGLLTGQGQTKARTYALKNIALHSSSPQIVPGLAEDAVWRQQVLPHIKDLPANIVGICQYGFCAIFGNVIAHSGSEISLIKYRQNYASVEMTVADYGAGIFQKLQKDFGWPDARSALLELSKGKLTADTTGRSGEGIFFASRLFDRFSITSGPLFFSQTRSGPGWQIETRDLADYQPGTVIRMAIATDTNRSLRDIPEIYRTQGRGFSRAHILVVLGRYPGEQLLSRAQARRILSRLDRLAEAVLDFSSVDEIGPDFADEIFRVFAAAHPDIRMVAANTNPDVARSIAHVR